jgi:hypothetical protein
MSDCGSQEKNIAHVKLIYLLGQGSLYQVMSSRVLCMFHWVPFRKDLF